MRLGAGDEEVWVGGRVDVDWESWEAVDEKALSVGAREGAELVVASGSVVCIATLVADVAGAGVAALRGVGTMIELLCTAELPTKGDEERLEDAGTGTFITGREACVVAALIGWEEARTADAEASVGVEERATVTTDEGDDGEVEASVGGVEARATVPVDDGASRGGEEARATVPMDDWASTGGEKAEATVTMDAGADGDDGEADMVLMVLPPWADPVKSTGPLPFGGSWLRLIAPSTYTLPLSSRSCTPSLMA